MDNIKQQIEFCMSKNPFYKPIDKELRKTCILKTNDTYHLIPEHIVNISGDLKGDDEMEKSLTVPQFKEILNLIWEKHRFGGLSNNKDNTNKNIKYIRPSFDMRFGIIFNIKFDEKMFDFRDDEERSMYDRIMEWLNTEND